MTKKLKLPKYSLAPVKKVKPGTRLITDDGFTCMGDHVTRIVKMGRKGELFVSCAQGRHRLDGQLDAAGKNYVGFWIAPDREPK